MIGWEGTVIVNISHFSYGVDDDSDDDSSILCMSSEDVDIWRQPIIVHTARQARKIISLLCRTNLTSCFESLGRLNVFIVVYLGSFSKQCCRLSNEQVPLLVIITTD